MARRWREITAEEAKAHPLYGIRGWLAWFAVFAAIVGPIVGLAVTIGRLHLVATDAGLTLSELLAADAPQITLVKLAVGMDLLVWAVLVYLLFGMRPAFRIGMSYVLLARWPIFVFFALAVQPPDVVDTTLRYFLVWSMQCGLLVTYLQRSRRVRVTYEHSVVADEDRFVARSNDLPPLNRASASGQRPKASMAAKGDEVQQPKGDDNSHQPVAAENLAIAPLETAVNEEAVYAKVASELDAGATDKGLWTRLFVECDGDERKTKLSYIKQRAERLIAVECSRIEEVSLAREVERTRDEEYRSRLRAEAIEEAQKLAIDIRANQGASAEDLAKLIQLVGGRVRWAEDSIFSTKCNVEHHGTERVFANEYRLREWLVAEVIPIVLTESTYFGFATVSVGGALPQSGSPSAPRAS